MLLWLLLSGEDAPAPPEPSALPPLVGLVLADATLVDGVSPARRADLHLIGGRIAAIGHGLEGAQRVDLDGAVVTPGLIDSHVHLTLQPGGALRELDLEALEPLMLRAFVAAGVTTVLDALALPSDMERIRAIDGPAPDIQALGLPPALPGSYGPAVLPRLPVITDAESLVAHLDRVAAEPVVGMKVLQERGIVRNTWPVLEGELAEVLVREAAARELDLYVHAMTGEETLEALALRPHALMHTPMRRDDVANAAVAEAGTWVVSTLHISASAMLEYEPERLDHPLALLLVPPVLRQGVEDRGLQRQSRVAMGEVALPHAPSWALAGAGSPRMLRRVHARHVDSVRGLLDAGARVVMGSDSPGWPVIVNNLHAWSSLEELVALEEAGMSPTQVLRAATSEPAEMMGLQDRGRIAEGLRADLVVHQSDPRVDVQAWKSARYVVLAGELRTPEGWLAD